MSVAEPKLSDLKQIKSDYTPLDADGDWLMSGGCVHLAIALKEVFPEGKIAVGWYQDHGRRAISHAVFYDPTTGHAFDGMGTHDYFDAAVSGLNVSEVERDASVTAIAEHMGIPYNPEAPFENDLIMEAWEFAERHFLPKLYAARLAEYGAEDDF